jgi:hypothetical protein
MMITLPFKSTKLKSCIKHVLVSKRVTALLLFFISINCISQSLIGDTIEIQHVFNVPDIKISKDGKFLAYIDESPLVKIYVTTLHYDHHLNTWNRKTIDLDPARRIVGGIKFDIAENNKSIALTTFLVTDSMSIKIYDLEDQEWKERPRVPESFLVENLYIQYWNQFVNLSPSGRFAYFSRFPNSEFPDDLYITLYEYKNGTWHKKLEDVLYDYGVSECHFNEEEDKMIVIEQSKRQNGFFRISQYERDGENWKKNYLLPQFLPFQNKLTEVKKLSPDGHNMHFLAPQKNVEPPTYSFFYVESGNDNFEVSDSISFVYNKTSKVDISANGECLAYSYKGELLSDDTIIVYKVNDVLGLAKEHVILKEKTSIYYADRVTLSSDCNILTIEKFIPDNAYTTRPETGKTVLYIYDLSKPSNVESLYETHYSKPKFYPNPTYGILYTDSIEEDTMFKIYSIDGQMLKNQNIKNNPIDISDLPNGIYFLETVQNGHRNIQKIVKME